MPWVSTYAEFITKIPCGSWLHTGQFYDFNKTSFREYCAFFSYPLAAVNRDWRPTESIKHFLLEARTHKPARVVATLCFGLCF